MKLVTESRVLSPALVEACRGELDQIDGRIRPGTVHRVGPTIQRLAGPEVPREESPQRIVARLRADLRGFVASQGLEHVVVVNVASTEPPVDPACVPSTWAELERQLSDPAKCRLPASSLYAIAALDLGYSYVNFTPSLGFSSAGDRRAGPPARHASHGLRRQDGRDAVEERAGPHVPASGTCK